MPPLFPPRLPHHPLDAPPKPSVGVVVLQAAADHLVRVGDGAGDQLGDAGDDDGRLVAHPRCLLCLHMMVFLAPGKRYLLLLLLLLFLVALSQVKPLDGIVHGELHGAVGDPQKADAQPPVEPAPPFVPQQARGAGPHARVRAGGGAVRRQHPRLHHPDRVRQDLGDEAGGGGGGEVVTWG